VYSIYTYNTVTNVKRSSGSKVGVWNLEEHHTVSLKNITYREALFGLETKQAEAALLDQRRMHLDVNKQH